MTKIFKAVLTLACVTCAMTASAQFTGGSKQSKSSAVADTEPYNRISLSYDNTHLGANDKAYECFMGEGAMSLNGVGFEYIHGFSISSSLPMFIESGIKAQFGAGSVSDYDKKEEYEISLKLQQFSFSVPVNYTYKFAIGDQMSIAPFVGINFKVHAMGRVKSVLTFDDDDLQDYYEDSDYYDEDWRDIFSKKDMGDKDDVWNRFQMGWQIGAGLNISALYIGLQYGTDLTPAWKYKKEAINTGNFAFKIGYNF